jgi:LemA protein
MGIGLIIGLAILFAILVVGIYVVTLFNGLVRLHNNIKKAWSNIGVLLKQRSDELPKLIDTVKGYMKHEKSTLKELTEARTSFMRAKTVSQKAKANNQITEALKSIFAVAENYPKLEANKSFMQLQDRISGIENEITDRREFYNDSVNQYNIRIQSVPDVIVARMLGYKNETLFEVSEEDQKDVKVEF